MNSQKARVQLKRSHDLWIYSFADLSLILTVFFVAIAAIYALKSKNQPLNHELKTASAGRGSLVAQSLVSVEFEPASAELKTMGMETLQNLLPILKSTAHGMIDIEGYADGSAMRSHSAYKSNLELSNRRAVSVAEWFMRNGVSPQRIRTYSYGDGHQWSRDSGVPSNRRVLVKLYSNGEA